MENPQLHQMVPLADGAIWEMEGRGRDAAVLTNAALPVERVSPYLERRVLHMDGSFSAGPCNVAKVEFHAQGGVPGLDRPLAFR